MRSETATLIFALIVACAFFATSAAADPVAPGSLSVQGSSSRDLGDLAAQTADAQGGNVTEININALTITQSWQGYYGDISGEITLDDGSNNTFYNWSLASADGEVYATRALSVTWSNVNCTNSTNITTEETFLGQSASDGDSVSNTFSGSTHPAFSAGTSSILADTCSSTHAFVNNASQSSDWVQVLLYDFTGDAVIYSTIINGTTTGFDGANHDFQLLVGENEHSGNEGVTQYYFWVELN